MSRMRIQVASLSDVPDDESRSDGQSGLLVTVTSIDTATTHLVRLLTTTDPSPPVLSQVGPNVWQFTPTNGPNTYRLECITDLGLSTESRTRRVYRIRSDNLGLAFPAPNERADNNASLINAGPAIVAASEDNEGGSPYGWQPALQGWLEAVDDLAVGRQDLESNVSNAWSLATGGQPFVEIDSTTANPRVRMEVPIELVERSGDPAAVADSGLLYTKDVAALTELFFRDSAGNVIRLTNSGAINVPGGAFNPENIDINDDTSGALRVHEGANDYVRVDTTNAAEQITLGNATTNPEFAWLGSGAWTVGGDAGSSGQVLTSNGPSAAPSWETVAGGSFDPENVPIADDTSGALRIYEGSNDYVRVNTSNTGASILLGNAVTNPDFEFLGTGVLRRNIVSDNLVIGSPTTLPSGTKVIALVNKPSGTWTGTSQVIIGQNTANLSGSRAIAINADGMTGTMSTDSITISSASSVAGGTRAIGIGGAVSAQGAEAVAIGYGANAGHANTVTLGRSATSTAASQFVVGGGGQPITNFYMGEGVTDATPPTTVAYRVTGGSGTDVAGTNLVLIPGVATGNAASGYFEVQTAPAGGSGATPQTPTARLRIDGTGQWLVGGAAGTSGQVLTSNGPSAAPTWQTVSGGSFDPEDIVLTDNTSGALRAYEGSNDYIRVNTSNGTEAILFGNTTTNPDIQYLGSGTLTLPTGGVVIPDNSGTAFVVAEGANTYLQVVTTNGVEQIAIGNTTTNPSVYFQTDGEWLVDGTPGSAGQVLTSNGAGSAPSWQTPSGGSFDPTSISLTDNLSGALRAHEGANDYIRVNTSNGTERVILGNATTNPVFELLGSGRLQKAGNIVFGDYSVLPSGTGVIAIGAKSAGSFTASNSIIIGTTTGNNNSGSVVLAASSMSGNAGGNSVTIGTGGSSVATGTRSIGIGHSATASTDDTIAIGYLATASGVSGVALGRGATASQTNTTAVGFSASASAVNATALGSSAAASANTALALGFSATASHANSVAIGRAAATTAANQIVIGGPAYAITDMFIGEGVADGSPPTNVTINATGASGTNVAGAALNLAGGRGTGTGAGGAINLRTAPAGVTGSSQNALVTQWSVDQNGILGRSGTQFIGSFSAVPAGSNVIAIGDFTTTTWTNNDQVIIGRTSGNNAGARTVSITAAGRTGSQGADSICIMGANGAGATGHRSIVIGSAGSASGTDSIQIGYGGVAGHANAICLGRDADSTASNQFIVGGTGYPIDDCYIGEGVTKATAFTGANKTIQPTEATGTDRDGQSLTLRGGRGTGSGTPGNLVLATYAAGVSGTTPHSLVERVSIDGSGNAYFGNGITNATASDGTIRATGGTGSNNAAGDLYLVAGLSTGNATPGRVHIAGAPPTTSGSTVQTQYSMMEFVPVTSESFYAILNPSGQSWVLGLNGSNGLGDEAGFAILRGSDPSDYGARGLWMGAADNDAFKLRTHDTTDSAAQGEDEAIHFQTARWATTTQDAWVTVFSLDSVATDGYYHAEFAIYGDDAGGSPRMTHQSFWWQVFGGTATIIDGVVIYSSGTSTLEFRLNENGGAIEIQVRSTSVSNATGQGGAWVRWHGAPSA